MVFPPDFRLILITLSLLPAISSSLTAERVHELERVVPLFDCICLLALSLSLPCIEFLSSLPFLSLPLSLTMVSN